MRTNAGFSIGVFAVAFAMIAAGFSQKVARGDPLPGEILKFSQLPLDATPVPRPTGTGTLYYGHDELSTVNLQPPTGGPIQGTGTFMADDFADKVTSDIVHVSWWGSYMGGENFTGSGVKQFLVAFESDVPSDASNPNSHPGSVLSAQIVNLGALAPTSGTFIETLVSPGGPPLGEHLYKYNAELHLPFHENANTVYWLKIVALVDQNRDGPIQWGWHDRDYTLFDPLAAGPPVPSPGERDLAAPADPFGPVWHFQDDAVQGPMGVLIDPAGLGAVVPGSLDQSGYLPKNYLDVIDGPSGIGQYSKDLAFQLFYVPEPGSAMILGLGTLALGLKRRR